MTIQDFLPEYWDKARSTSEGISGTYRHEYLEVEIIASKIEIEGGQWVYSFMIRWADDFGAVEADFDVGEDIESEQSAEDWLIALMTQIDNQYTPGDTEYVDRAMEVTKGNSVGEPDSETFKNFDTCPACNAPLFQFRGFDSYEQAQNHFKYMDDEAHQDWEVSLEER